MQKEDTNRHRKVKCPCLPTNIIQAPDMTQTCYQDFTPEFWSKGFIPSFNVILPTTRPPHTFYKFLRKICLSKLCLKTKKGGIFTLQGQKEVQGSMGEEPVGRCTQGERVRAQAYSHHFSLKCYLPETFSVAILKKLGLCDCCQYTGETYKRWNQRNLDKNPNLPLNQLCFLKQVVQLF